MYQSPRCLYLGCPDWMIALGRRGVDKKRREWRRDRIVVVLTCGELEEECDL